MSQTLHFREKNTKINAIYTSKSAKITGFVPQIRKWGFHIGVLNGNFVEIASVI